MAARKPELSVRLLGNFALELDGSPFVMPTPRRTLPILAYLLLHRSAAVSREFLAYLMWPDEAEDSARTKLRANLFDLARILPQAPAGHWVLADGDNVQWNPQARTKLDVEEFEALCARPERREEAVALYRGELLASLYDEWIFPPRERYRTLYLNALTELVSDARRHRDFPKAIARAQELLGVDQWREDVVRRLIAIRYESGDRAGALADYQRFAQTLRQELDIDPMPETIALREAIARDASIEPEPEESVTKAVVARTVDPLPFIGRAAELALLEEAWTRAARGAGGAVVISGESGVGKSRLTLEFAHRVEELGGRVAAGTTGSPEAIPYQCIVEALRSAVPLIASLRLRDVWLANVAALVPELRGHLPALPDSRIETAGDRPRLFEALVRTLSALAGPRPLLLVFEDLHWADEATCAALDFLMSRLSTMRVLLLVTLRDDAAPGSHLRRLLGRAATRTNVTSVSLGALSSDDVEQLARSLPGTTGEVAALLASSGGNPLFLTQLVEGGEWSGGVGGVGAVVARRVASLSAEARTIAEIAALAGTRFSREVVRRVSGWDGAAADDALDELIDRRIVRETTGRGFLDYAFAHQVVQEYIASVVPPQRSPARRRRIARALGELYPDRSAELAASIARQYDLAGELEAAAERYLHASRHALSVGAVDEASVHVARGLALAGEKTLRIELFFAGETVATRSGRNDSRAAALAELEALTEGDGERRRELALRRFEFAHELEDRAGAEAALEQLDLLSRDDRGWTGKAEYARARDRLAGGDLPAAESRAADALRAFLDVSDRTGEAEARYLLAEIVTHRGDLARAEGLLEEARAAGERAQDAPLSIRALHGSFQLAFSRRDLARCLDVAGATLEAGLASGDRRAEAEGHRSTAATLLNLGVRYADAREHFRAAIAIFEEIGDPIGSAVTIHNAAQLELILGEIATAREQCKLALAEFTAKGGTVRRRITALLTLATAELAGGDAPSAKTHTLEAFELARAAGYRVLEASALEDVAYAEAGGGEYAAAIEHMTTALRLRDETDSTAWNGVSYAFLALWSAAAGRLDEARVWVARAYELEHTLASASPWPQACYWAIARTLRTCGDEAGAVKAFDRAHELTLAALASLDGVERGSFLALPWHREVLAAADDFERPRC